MGPINKQIEQAIIFLLLAFIKGYRRLISIWLGEHCRFYPSCSAYTEQALSEYGLRRGIYFSLRRLLSCHPFHPGGYDPVPKQTLKLSKKPLPGK